MTKVKKLKISVDFELISLATGRVFRGRSRRGEYEGVLRVETTLPVSAYTNVRYFAGIVRRFIEEKTAEWKLKGQLVVDDELGAGLYEVGNEIRSAFRSGRVENISYSLRQTKYIVHIETDWKATPTSDYGVQRTRTKEEV